VELVPRLLVEALEIGESQKREAFLRESCGSDLALRQEVERLFQAEASIALLPDHTTLAAGCKDGSVRLWDTSTVAQDRSRVTFTMPLTAWRFAMNSFGSWRP
jgi:WD40 repeat protein